MDDRAEMELRLHQLDSYAEQLRATHFTLLATMLVVVVGTIVSSEGQYAPALQELDSIRAAVAGNHGTLGSSPQSWNSSWLDERLLSTNKDLLIPGLVLDGGELLKSIDALSPQASYRALGHAFRVKETPSDLTIERIYAASKEGPLFYSQSARNALREAERVVLFFYPCVHFRSVATKNTGCGMLDGYDLPVAFVDDAAAKIYSVLREEPKTLGQFESFWNSLAQLRIETYSVPADVDHLVVLTLESDPASRDLSQAVNCSRVPMHRDKTLVVPERSQPIGFALSTWYFDPAAPAGGRVNLKSGVNCAPDSNFVLEGKILVWKAGYYGFIDPFHSFGSKYTPNGASEPWFAAVIPVTDVSWRNIDGISLFDARFTSVSSRPFEQAFSDLSSVTTRLRTLNLGDLRLVLLDQRERQGESVSLFGVSIPLAFLFYFGVVAIVSLQLYMVAYATALLTLARRFPEAFGMQNFPWVGLTPGIIWHLLSIGTVSVLPISLISWLAVISHFHKTARIDDVVGVVAVCSVLAISTCLARVIYQIRLAGGR